MSAGVLYLVWPSGNGRDVDRSLARSVQSLRRVHPDIPVQVRRMPQTATLLDKAAMHALSPFDVTLYLDADTVVFDDLTYGFESARRWGIACAVCEAPDARRFDGMPADYVIEYNTGVLFWSAAHGAGMAAMRRWADLAKRHVGRLPFRTAAGPAVMPINDQASFALSMRDFNPHVLPMTWNLRPLWQRQWFGRVRIWHDWSDPPPWFVAENAKAAPGDAGKFPADFLLTLRGAAV